MKKVTKKLTKTTYKNGREDFKKQANKYACRKTACRKKKGNV